MNSNLFHYITFNLIIPILACVILSNLGEKMIQINGHFWPRNLVKIPNQFYIFELLYLNSLFIVLALLYPVYISFQAFRLDCCFETLYFGSKTSNCKWYVNIKRKFYYNSLWKHVLNCFQWFTLGVTILCSVFACDSYYNCILQNYLMFLKRW